MSLLDIIPTWVKVAVGVALVAAVGIVIYQWRADIQTAAYDAIFKKQVEALMEANKKDFETQLAGEAEKREALAEQIENQKQIASDLEKLRQAFLNQKFENRPIDPGLKYVFDQIRAAEAARKAAAQKPKPGSKP